MTTREKPASKPCRLITRRRLIALSVLAAGGAHAQQKPGIVKASKKVAGYLEKSDDSTQNCSQCHFYINPFNCMIVEGPVSPWGYCNYYAD